MMRHLGGFSPEKGEKGELGFSTMEVLVVLVIIAILGSIVAANLFQRIGQAKQVAARNQIESFSLALHSYRLDTGDYPTTEQGLQALREKPAISPVPANWVGPYIEKEVPQDPWGRPYIYVYPGEKNPGGFDLYSLGKDGLEGGEGEDADITNWSLGPSM